jgi:hypothetical protein
VLAFILSCLQMAGWLTLLVIFLWHKIGSVSSS